MTPNATRLLCLIALITTAMSTANAQQQAASCEDENHRAFDFWVGTWTVTTADGKPAGNNSIEKIQNGCALRESWTSASSGFTGTSLNFYNPEKNQWQQLWVDNQGGHLELSGQSKDKQMILSSNKAKDKEGNGYFHRITWTHNDDGSVRQLWETIKDNGNITVAFDGLYKKAN